MLFDSGHLLLDQRFVKKNVLFEVDRRLGLVAVTPIHCYLLDCPIAGDRVVLVVDQLRAIEREELCFAVLLVINNLFVSALSV